MKRRTLMQTIVFAMFWPPILAQAEERSLQADEIEKLLTGNTISGTWSGRAYKQYYGTGGFTVYVTARGRADQGRWRVNHDTNQYESWWQITGWGAYTLVETSGGYAWVHGKSLQPFEVLEGKQVNW